MKYVWAILVLSLIIIIHELGHFIIAKASGLFGSSKKIDEIVPSTTPETTIEPTEAVKNTVPNVENLKLDNVKSQLEELGLTVVTTEETSDSVDAGYIISQDLEPGTEITDGMTINLVVSSGSEKYSVTNVSGYTASDATAALQRNGFKVVESSEYSDTVDAGKVIRTDPAAGTQVEKGTTVTIYVSKGPEDTSVSVPKLSGLTTAQAKEKLAAVGLVLSNTVSYEYDSTVAKDKIISQSYTAGSKVEKGTTISVTVSLGVETTYKYIGSISISDNPFNSEDETGMIKLILKQDGKSKTIYEESHSLGDFPLPAIEVEGYSTSNGQVYMYLDGQLVGGPYTVSFKKVAE